MTLRGKALPALLMLCLVCGALTACGVTASSLHVVRIGSGATQPSLDTTVHDTAKIQQLYTAALKLPVARGVFSCPADNGVVYHLTFVGATFAFRQMDLAAAGCRFLCIPQQPSPTQCHLTTDAFISLFMQTVGIFVLDPDFPPFLQFWTLVVAGVGLLLLALVIAGVGLLLVALVMWMWGQRGRSLAMRWLSLAFFANALVACFAAGMQLVNLLPSDLWQALQLAAWPLSGCAFVVAGVYAFRKDTQRISGMPR